MFQINSFKIKMAYNCSCIMCIINYNFYIKNILRVFLQIHYDAFVIT